MPKDGPDGGVRGPDGDVPGSAGDAGAGLDDDDDLAEMAAERSGRARWVIALILALALAVPATGALVDQFAFGRSGDEVQAELGGDASLTDSVLLVRTVRCDGQVSTGSAFAVEIDGTSVVVTNRHVVERAGMISVRPIGGGTSSQVASHRVSMSADVAVLELGGTVTMPTALEANESVAVGQPIRVVGFPGGRPALTEGTVRDVGTERLLLDLRVQGGASGSPVIDADGRAVGQVMARAADGAGIAMPLGVVIDAARGAIPAPAC